MNLDEQEAMAFLRSLFPGGLKDPALISELCPEGWEASPLFACYHPSPEVRYAESLEFSRNLKNLTFLMSRRKVESAQAPPDEPELTFEEFLAKNPPKDAPLSPEARIHESGELLGLCLWDVFSDNHDVIAADGRIVHLGSFRGSAGTISDFFESFPPMVAADANDGWHMGGCGYMDFYMGTWWVGSRADLSAVYRLIFKRLRAHGADWAYAFPRIHVIDSGPREVDSELAYDPSAAFQREGEQRARAEETAKLRRQLDRDAQAAKRRARTGPPPATVSAYQEVFGRFPQGWPPDPYPEKSEF